MTLANHDERANERDDEGLSRVLLGVVWRNHIPHVRTRRFGQESSELVPVAGWKLSYRIEIDAERTCLGHIPFRKGRNEYHDCQKPPQPGSRLCERCAIVEATFASNLHHAHHKSSGELDASVREHLEQPNRLYLAGFRDGTIKIGTSTLSRANTRLEEQGAWAARFVAETTNGREIRHLEDAVTEQLGITQAVSATRKHRGLISPLADHLLAAALQAAANDVHNLVNDHAANSEVTPLDEAWHHPMAAHSATANVLAYPLTLAKGRHDLRAVTAIGRHLLVQRSNGDDVFALDLTPILGRWLEMGEFGSDEIAIQDSLF